MGTATLYRWSLVSQLKRAEAVLAAAALRLR
jgi:hypothetical protein